MIRKLILAGIILIGISLVFLAFFDPALRILLGISGSLASTTFRGSKAFLRTLQNGAGFGLGDFLLGTFLGFGLAVVGLMLTVVGTFARPSHQVNVS